MNKIIIIGNLTKQPELSTTASGISVCKFTVAVNRPYSQDGEKAVDFFNVTTFRGLADNCGKFLDKGRKVCVVGALQFRTYEKDGITRQASDLVAENVEFLSSTNNEAKEEAPSTSQNTTADTLPF